MAGEKATRRAGAGNLVIACGGTGGHLFPGIAVAEAWKARGGEALLIISEKQIDALAAEGYAHLRFERQRAIALPRLWSPRMIGFAAGFLAGLKSSRRLFAEFRADAALGMGGFTSAAPLAAARWAGLPAFVHESNAIPGRANLLNARFCRRVLVGFEACAARFGARPVTVTGTPLRPSLRDRPGKAAARESFGLHPDRTTLLVMGGSQGARRLNELAGEALAHLPPDRVQLLHISGPQDHDAALAAHRAAPPGLGTALLPFCGEMQRALAAADLAVCRAGASTLTELACYGLPAVLVPYPYAAHDHQTRNAEIFQSAGAAELWPQGELEGESFARRLVALLDDGAKRDRMSAAMEALSVPDAADRVCEVIASSLAGANPGAGPER